MFLGFLLLHLPAPALACSFESLGHVIPTEPLGWTADGRYFAYRAEQWSNDAARARLISVVDVHTDHVTFFVEGLDDTEDADEAMLATWRAYATAEQWAAWSAANPTTLPAQKATCGDARLVFEVAHLGGYAAPPAAGEPWDGSATRLAARDEAWATMGVERDGQRWTHIELNANQGGFTVVTASASWSPDCKFVAWVLAGYAPGRSDRWRVPPYNPSSAVVVSPAGPLIHIMAHRTASHVAEPLRAALDAAGFAPHIGPRARGDRDATVVYARSASRPLAERVAAAVPGGATVDVLNWPTPADVIVAAGRSVVGDTP